MEQALSPESPSGRALVIAEATVILSRTPAVLEALLRGLDPVWTCANEGSGTWSPFDVVGHLLHAERTNWLPRVRVILEQGEGGVFEDFDRLGQRVLCEGWSVDQVLDAFGTERQASLSVLEDLTLTPAMLALRGRHPALGVVSLRQLLAAWVAHDLDHLAQVARVLARQYSGEVGPWREYLRVINGRGL